MCFLCCKSYIVMKIKALEDVSSKHPPTEARLVSQEGPEEAVGRSSLHLFSASLLLRSGRVALMCWVFSSSSVCQMNFDVEFSNFEDITTASPGGTGL